MELDKYEKCPFVFPADYSEGILQSSPKLELCVGIVNECVKEGDKIIIFSQSLDTLNMIEKFLKATKDYEWEKNWNYFRIDGLTSQQERCKMLREYDINENIILFLMSTKTCSLGLNLTVANRIIIFDNCWNPCLDMQAISRVHRYGQKKNCVIYRFVTDNCLEKSVYDRQINKQLMFARVVDATCPQPLLSLNENKSVLNVTENKMENFDFTDSYQDSVMQAIYRISSNLMSGPPFEHQSFLVERDLNLSIEEKKEAMNSYKLASSMQYNSDSDQNENSLPMQVVKRKIVGRNRRKNIDESGKMRMIGTPEPKKRRVFTDNSNCKGENTTESQSNPNEGESSGSVQSMCVESNGANDRVDEGVEIAKSAWVPLEMWQQQGIDAKLVKLDNDVSLKRNGRSITLKQGETTMIIKGKYVQLSNGELIAIK